MKESPDETTKSLNEESTNVALLSCELCTRRKIRCDKRQPCSACVKAGKDCVPVMRARLPRGRRGGRKEANIELRSRVRRLEDLILSLSASNATASSLQTPPGFSDADINTHVIPDGSEASGQGSLSPAPIVGSPANDISRSLGSTVWTQLSNELSGLRSVLESNDEYDEYETKSNDEHLATAESAINFGHIEESAASRVFTGNISKPTLRKFMNVFSHNADPVVKLVHLPSFANSIEHGHVYLGYPVSSYAFEALRSAAFYTSICTLDESKCLEYFGEAKGKLRERWQTSSEHWLRKADLTINHNIVAFQALLLYLAANRTHNNRPRTWTLMGLLVRVAHALQLHREDSYSTLSFFQAQNHRRGWFCLLGFDFQASFDRGSDPAVPANSYNTKFPANINDAEFGPDFGPTWTNTCQFTDMTFSIVAAECEGLVRQLTFVPAGDMAQPPSPLQYSWEVRQEAVESLRERLTRNYLQHCNAAIPIQFATLYLGKVILSCLELYVVRPFQRHPALSRPPPGAVNILLRATEVLEEKEKFRHNLTQPWHWLFTGYVDWHPLATLLAELCTPQDDQELVQRAWRAADIAFEELAARIAEGTQGTLWRPLKKLMRMAQQRRALDHPHEKLAADQAWPNQDMPALSRGGADINTSMPGLDAPMQMDFGFGAQPMDDSWMNWQGFMDDITQSNSMGWTTDLEPIPIRTDLAGDFWPGHK